MKRSGSSSRCSNGPTPSSAREAALAGLYGSHPRCPKRSNPNAPPRPRRFIGAALVAEYKPDVPITELGKLQEHFRGGTGEPWEWPKILPMWWGYKNPVSGRQPELFLPDCVPCGYSPNMSMVKHGYLLPTTDPVKRED